MEGPVVDEQFLRFCDRVCDSQSKCVFTKSMLRLPDQLTVGACGNASIVVDVARDPSQDLHLSYWGGGLVCVFSHRPTAAHFDIPAIDNHNYTQSLGQGH